eukprot:466981-Rhodomonas_salina.3
MELPGLRRSRALRSTIRPVPALYVLKVGYDPMLLRAILRQAMLVPGKPLFAQDIKVRNQTQEHTPSVQFVPGMRCFVFDFDVYSMRVECGVGAVLR